MGRSRWRLYTELIIYAVAFIYMFIPFDFIPDAPFVGLIDDFIVIVIAIALNKLITFISKK